MSSTAIEIPARVARLKPVCINLSANITVSRRPQRWKLALIKREISFFFSALLINGNGNPSGNGYSVLDFGDNLNAEKYITLSNSLGQVIRQWVVADGSSTFEIQTSDLQSGIYMVTVKVGNRFYTRKLVH